MVKVEVDEKLSIAVIEPKSELHPSDFETIRDVVDPYIEKKGGLKGVVILSRDFPSWNSFQALVSHIKFVKDHHKNIPRVAIVTDSSVGNLASSLANHFVMAKVEQFPFDQFEQAKQWILE